jgi:hypothetical protein
METKRRAMMGAFEGERERRRRGGGHEQRAPLPLSPSSHTTNADLIDLTTMMTFSNPAS